MDLWRAELRESRFARRLSWLLHAGVIGLLLVFPPADGGLSGVLIALVALECRRSLRRIRRHVGMIAQKNSEDWQWQGHGWLLARRPLQVPQGVLLTLQDRRGKRERLWLMHDSMDEADWRALRVAAASAMTSLTRKAKVTATRPSR